MKILWRALTTRRWMISWCNLRNPYSTLYAFSSLTSNHVVFCFIKLWNFLFLSLQILEALLIEPNFVWGQALCWSSATHVLWATIDQAAGLAITQDCLKSLFLKVACGYVATPQRYLTDQTVTQHDHIDNHYHF